MKKSELIKKHPEFAEQLGIKPAKKRKYNNNPLKTPYGHFDSTGEHKRYLALLELQKRREIANLCRQVTFPFYVVGKDGNAERVGSLRVDFLYLENGRLVAEDYKGCRTKSQSRNEKLWSQCYDFELRITGPGAKK